MQPNAWKVLKSFLAGKPVRPPPPQLLAEKMKNIDMFRESVSQLDDGTLESIINKPSMQIMNWTLNPAISMTRFSEATIRNSQLQGKKDSDDGNEDEESNGHQQTESDQNNSRMHSVIESGQVETESVENYE